MYPSKHSHSPATIATVLTSHRFVRCFIAILCNSFRQRIHPKAIRGTLKASHARSSCKRQALLAKFGNSRRLVFFPLCTNVSGMCHELAHWSILRRIFWLPGGEPIDVPVEHAEGRGNEDGVMNFQISCPLCAGCGDVI